MICDKKEEEERRRRRRRGRRRRGRIITVSYSENHFLSRPKHAETNNS
jgi:hypothetical protein